MVADAVSAAFALELKRAEQALIVLCAGHAKAAEEAMARGTVQVMSPDGSIEVITVKPADKV